jgi:hypothetical protein
VNHINYDQTVERERVKDRGKTEWKTDEGKETLTLSEENPSRPKRQLESF